MKAIVFDLDGTLLHFTREYRAALAEAVESVAGRSPDRWLDTYHEQFFELLGDQEPEPYRRAFAAIEDGPDPERLVEALRRTETEMVRPPEGARSDLQRLGEQYHLGVLTNGVREWQAHKLEAYDLDGYFDAFVASYEAGAHKPATEPYRLLEERLPAEEYAMIGDADADLEGASAAGWTAHRYEEQGFGELPEALVWE